MLEACRADDDLRREVESLLAQQSIDASFDHPAFEIEADSKVVQIASGATLGPYKIGAHIGKGGMGEVFRATDTRLGREVAIKVCHERFSERFQREARLISSLNHPNICTLYDVGPNYLVMEVVEGITLAERIRQGALPMEEALRVAAQIAAALEEAHERRIVHRDLKPVNVKIRPDGVVKVLDFGLAKEHREVRGETLTINDTQKGVVMGTPAYMPPEQARGQTVDKTADVWAFGVVLYEMLTGERLFQGDSTAVILSAVLHQEPDLNRVPARVHRLLRSCLEKDPARRFRHIGDIALLLESSDEAVQTAARWRWWPAVATALALALVAVFVIAMRTSWLGTTQTVARPLMRLSVDLGSDVPFDGAAQVILSPDGTRLVYSTRGRLFTRSLDQLKAVELAAGSPAYSPFFSPDGKWVAFFTGLLPGNQLKKISVAGGEPVTLCAAFAASGSTWGEDGNIVFANKEGLARVSSMGGTPAQLTALAGEDTVHRFPQVLPGGKAVLFTSHSGLGGFNSAAIEVFSLTDQRRKVLHRGGSFGRYLPSGHLVYVNRGRLFAVPFDSGTLETRGTPATILEGIAFSETVGFAAFDFSRVPSGPDTFVYQEADKAGQQVTIQWLDAAGKMQPLLAKPGAYGRPRLSPDGRRLALQVTDDEGSTDNWVYDHERDIMQRLTSSGEGIGYSMFSPDGKYIVFERPSGLSWTRSDGGSKPQVLIAGRAQRFPWSFTPDGKRLAYSETSPLGGFDIWTVPIEDGASGLRVGKPEPFLQSPSTEAQPAFSPDGRWIAYLSNESGRNEVYVRAYPDRGAKLQISSEGGAVPWWSRDGRQLFFRNQANTRIMTAGYTVRGDSFLAEKPRVWVEKKLFSDGGNYDLAPDGKRIVMLVPADRPADQKPKNRLMVLLNFFDEVRRRAPIP